MAGADCAKQCAKLVAKGTASKNEKSPLGVAHPEQALSGRESEPRLIQP
jgi:hypothetical protein